jgi:protein gp37
VSANTEIGWTDHTWPVIRGCSKVSDGCKFCWAIRDAHLHAGNKNPKMQEHFGGLTVIENGRPNWTGVVRLDESILNWPLHWKKPARIFAASSGDLFHENLLNASILLVFEVMKRARWHTYQVLTKRPERLAEAMPMIRSLLQYDFPNVWLGVSVEDQANKYRIDLLRQTPAAVRFLSIEPLLEDIGKLDLTGIHWVIVGGESGPGARPFWIDWADDIIQQCKAARVPVFVKQVGLFPNGSGFPHDFDYRKRDRKGANMDEWPERIRVREFPR